MTDPGIMSTAPPDGATIRALQPSDLDGIMRVQLLCYGPDFLESRASFTVKIAGSDTCLGVFNRDEMLGYAIAFPWTAGTPVPLNHGEHIAPAEPDCLYIHDVAIDPAAQGSRLGDALVDVLRITAQRLSLGAMELIAVQGAATYWQRLGFHPHDTASVDYGPDAQKMRHMLNENLGDTHQSGTHPSR